MSEEGWTRADDYLEDRLNVSDEGLATALRESASAGLPSIQVSPLQGKLLHLLAASIGARRILEIGTLGGYSTIWMTRALPPEGRLISLEADPKHANVARRNLERAGLAGRSEVRVGPALASLPKLAEEGGAPFDLIFIDADKPNTPAYFDWAMQLSHPGTLIVVDNVVKHLGVGDAAAPDASTPGMREFVERLASEPGASGTVLQTVGRKGYDGFALIRVTAPRPARTSHSHRGEKKAHG
jgi:predicted O-methyltransferase YrrM